VLSNGVSPRRQPLSTHRSRLSSSSPQNYSPRLFPAASRKRRVPSLTLRPPSPFAPPHPSPSLHHLQRTT
jgi:hypothetical protein